MHTATLAWSLSIALLAVGAVRVGLWLAGALFAFNHRLYTDAIGFSAAAFAAGVFTITNAGIRLPSLLVALTAFLATPIAGAIVGSYHRAVKRAAHAEAHVQAYERALDLIRRTLPKD